jgi:hypothetical protein
MFLWQIANKMKTSELRQIIKEELEKINKSLGFKEMEELAKKAAVDFVSKKNLGSVKNILVTNTTSRPDEVGKEYQAAVDVVLSTGKTITLRIIHNINLKLVSVTPIIYPTSSPSMSGRKINLTPTQKTKFLNMIRNLSVQEDYEYAFGEAGNVLARIITNNKAEFIEDIEDFGYNSDEVEQYAQDLMNTYI